ncbi:MAG: glycerate kinase [Armatimonadetes bacterium]|nr:glycerate kinase [Armatimonadota bacterium]
MKIIICPDSFKGSLSSVEACDAIARGIELGAGSRPVEIVKVPLADGGEGTVNALVRTTGGELRHVMVHDPLMRVIESFYGIMGDGRTAAIEMAAASGLCLLTNDERNPLITSTYGTGELILAAVRAGVEKIVIGIGGSATNDGGAGAMAALGARFLDMDGNELSPGGAAFADLARIDISGFEFPVDKVAVEVACDVTNPLCGPQGASAIFGPQKGATPEMVTQLDAALVNYSEVIKRDLGKDVAEMPGAGAAGGLGAGLAAFLNARLRSGIDMVLDAAKFDEALAGADLVITGEGRIDEQTAYGKTIGGVLKRTSRLGVPVVAIAGSVSGDIRTLFDMGLTAAFSIVPGPVSLDYAMEHAGELIEAVSANVTRIIMS